MKLGLPLCAVLMGMGTISGAQQDVGAIKAEVQKRLNLYRAQFGFPGATAAFVTRDGEVVTVASGFSDVEAKTPMDPESRMLAGSTGKTFFAAAFLQVLQKSGFGLDLPISRWFAHESWFFRLPSNEEITLRSLMNHSSGLKDHVRVERFVRDVMAKPDKQWTGDEMLEYILDEVPEFAPGEGFSYADTNYILVAMVLEKLSRESAYQEIEKRFLLPLDLTGTEPSVSREIDGLAVGYARGVPPFTHQGRMVTDGKLLFNPQMEWGGGGYVSTSGDLASWAFALYGQKVLGEDLTRQMLDGIPSNIGPGERYGLGVQIRNTQWGECHGHAGWFPGYLTDMAYFPKLGVAVAVQFNTDDMRRVGRAPLKYLEEFAGLLRPAQPRG